jgi:pimeloyl-ACP methyl ester carboxylesterase
MGRNRPLLDCRGAIELSKLLRSLLITLLLLSLLGCGLLDDVLETWIAGDDQEYYDDDAGGGAGLGGEIGVFEPVACQYGEDYGVELECGTVAVPENHADPDGSRVVLAVTIVRSPGGARFADPVVFLEGGPGGSATANVAAWLGQPFLADRDLILFDQRGTGWSEPSLNCIELEVGDTEELDAAQDCFARLMDEGIDLAHYNSAASAADLTFLRKALSYDEWNLLGISYGSRLALTALRDQPEGIRSVILDSVYPPEVNAYEEEPLNGVRAFEKVFAGCAADAACRRAYPDLEQMLYDLLADLQAEPVEFTVFDPWTDEEQEVLLDGVELASMIFQSLYDTATLPWIPYAINQLARENYEEAWILLLGGEAGPNDGRRVGARQEEDLTDAEGHFYSVECYEEIPFNSASAAAALARAHPSPLVRYLMPDTNIVFEVCEIWDVGRGPAIENDPVRSDVPALVLAGDYDPITPPAWAQSAARYLGNSFYFEFPGVGHGVVDTECGSVVVLEFLNTPRVRPNSRCLSRLGPPRFFTP